MGDAMDTIRAQPPSRGSSKQDSLQVCKARMADALAQHHSSLSDVDVDRTKGAVMSLAHRYFRPFLTHYCRQRTEKLGDSARLPVLVITHEGGFTKVFIVKRTLAQAYQC